MRADLLELTDEQHDKFIDLLEKRGFRHSATSGHIFVREEVWDFPRNEDGLPLPVGYLAGKDLLLVNLKERFPEDYHAQLRQLYKEIIEGV
jgi:hypothetical protein